MDANVLAAVSALGGAVIGSAVSVVLQGKQIRHERDQLRATYKTEFMAEDAAKSLLTHERYECRRFDAIRAKLGGYEDNELRKILVRAGAVRINRGDGEEWWILLSRESKYLDKKK